MREIYGYEYEREKRMVAYRRYAVIGIVFCVVVFYLISWFG